VVNYYVNNFVGSILVVLYIDTDIVHRMALIFNIEVESFELFDGEWDLIIELAHENAIIDVDNKNNVSALENTFVNQWLLETNAQQLLNQVLVPNLTSLLLAIKVVEE
jgi:hypothetical protein